jgi:hypothetical protein
VLGFMHPTTGERLLFEVPAPSDFQRAVKAVRAIKSDP